LLASSTRHWIDRLRSRDAIGRTGGDEFLLILPGTTMEQAEHVVAGLVVGSPGAWSSGVAMAKPGDTTESLLERADRRMYRDKAARRSIDVPTTGNGPTVLS
jgi:GGDEF domain-containing protein